MIPLLTYKFDTTHKSYCNKKISMTNVGLYSQKSAMIYENKLPNIAFKGNYMLGSDNQDKNKIWTKKFDEAFENNDAKEFLNFINQKTKLKPIFTASNNDLTEILNPKNILSPIIGSLIENDTLQSEIVKEINSKDFPIQNITLKTQNEADNISITANKTGHIQINNSSLGNLFIERSSFENSNNMQESDKDIIADGARGFDPFDQEDWTKVIGRKWPTAENTRDPKGVANLSVDDSNKAIFLTTKDSITSSYGTKPRAMAVLDKENNSVILAFQQENKNPDIDFAAWSILPFKIREGKKTVAIFPADKRTVQNYKNPENDELDEIRKSNQWGIDENKFFVVDVSKPSTKTEYADPYADWCLFATQDEDIACLVRSCYKDNTDSKQFKVFSGQEDLGGTKYFELEFIAPKVSKNHKSTLVYRIEFISLKKLGFDSLNEDNMDSQIKEIGKTIENKINWTKTLSNITLTDT